MRGNSTDAADAGDAASYDTLPIQLAAWKRTCAAHVPALFLLSRCGKLLFSAADESPKVFVWLHDTAATDARAAATSGITSTAHSSRHHAAAAAAATPTAAASLPALRPHMVLETKSHPRVVGLLDYQPSPSKQPPQPYNHKLLCVGSNGAVSQWCAATGRCLRVSTKLFVQASRRTCEVHAVASGARALLLLHGTTVLLLDTRSLQVLTQVGSFGVWV
jgi:hypothetical protein